ncbi:MAG: hypothetical protein ACRD2J_00865 [Thermoanaerobaculia bacterium]
MHKKLFTISAVLAAALAVGCATYPVEPAYELAVYRPDTTEIGSIEPAATVYTTGGPVVTGYLPTRNATTQDDQVVSGIVIRSWREADGARVRAYALVPRQGAPNAFTTDATLLAEREIGTYFLAEGDSQRLCEMAAFGVEPFYVAYMPTTGGMRTSRTTTTGTTTTRY